MTTIAQKLGRLRRVIRPPRKLSFTREGKIIVVLAVGVGLAAVNTGNNLLYLLLGWLLSFIIASGILSEMTLRGLRITRRPPPQLMAGQPFLMEIEIANDKTTRASYSLEVEDLQRGTPLDKKTYFLKIPQAKSQQASYRHTFLHRGRHRLDGFRISTKFPFALFRKSKDVDAVEEFVVHPAVHPVQRPMLRARSTGTTTSSRIGRRGEFFGLREYRLGDDRRDVHWRSSARDGRLRVREYEDEHAHEVTIVVDNSLPRASLDAIADGSIDPLTMTQQSALERAISLAASLAVSYLASGWTVSLVARGHHEPRGAGRVQEHRILRALALLPTTTQDEAFSAPISNTSECLLIVPRGVMASGRPVSVSSTVEA